MADFGLTFDCQYIDYSKAFYKVSVSLLLEKREEHELCSRTSAWIGLMFDCQYTDFSKALDKVSVNLRLEKWEKYELGSRTSA